MARRTDADVRADLGELWEAMYGPRPCCFDLTLNKPVICGESHPHMGYLRAINPPPKRDRG